MEGPTGFDLHELFARHRGEAVTPWPMRMFPSEYLLRYPNGRHAPLAREIRDREIDRNRKLFDAYEPAIAAAFRVLAEHFGSSLHDDPEQPHEERTLHSALEHLFAEVELGGEADGWSDNRPRQDDLHCRLVAELGSRLQGHGTLGLPRKAPLRPEFWRLKITPREYLWRIQRTRQNELLARAAILPFESAIEEELMAVARALQSALTGEDPYAAETIFRAALRVARWRVVHVRYGENQSHEHYRRIEGWLGATAVGRVPPFGTDAS